MKVADAIKVPNQQTLKQGDYQDYPDGPVSSQGS